MKAGRSTHRVTGDQPALESAQPSQSFGRRRFFTGVQRMAGSTESSDPDRPHRRDRNRVKGVGSAESGTTLLP
jgi:hypothetical protein